MIELEDITLDNKQISHLIDKSKWNEYALKHGGILFVTSEVPGLMDGDSNLYQFFQLASDARKYINEGVNPEDKVKRVKEGIEVLSSIVKERILSNDLVKFGDALYNMIDKASDMSSYTSKEEMTNSLILLIKKLLVLESF